MSSYLMPGPTNSWHIRDMTCAERQAAPGSSSITGSSPRSARGRSFGDSDSQTAPTPSKPPRAGRMKVNPSWTGAGGDGAPQQRARSLPGRLERVVREIDIEGEGMSADPAPSG